MPLFNFYSRPKDEEKQTGGFAFRQRQSTGPTDNPGIQQVNEEVRRNTAANVPLFEKLRRYLIPSAATAVRDMAVDTARDVTRAPVAAVTELAKRQGIPTPLGNVQVADDVELDPTQNRAAEIVFGSEPISGFRGEGERAGFTAEEGLFSKENAPLAGAAFLGLDLIPGGGRAKAGAKAALKQTENVVDIGGTAVKSVFRQADRAVPETTKTVIDDVVVKPIKQQIANTTISDKPRLTKEVPGVRNRLDTGANEILDGLERSLFDRGADVDDLQKVREVIVSNPKAFEKAAGESTYRGMRSFSQTRNVMASDWGGAGARFADEMINGAKFEADWNNTLFPLADKFRDSLDKLAKTPIGRTEYDRRIRLAIENPSRRAELLTGQTDEQTQLLQEAYEAATQIEQLAKKELLKRGRPVRQNHTPWRYIDDQDEIIDPGLAKKLNERFGDRSPTAGFLKKRTKEEANIEDLEDLYDTFPKYISSVGKELSYRDPMEKFFSNLVDGKVNSMFLADKSQQAEKMEYLNKLITDAVNPKRLSKRELGVKKAIGRVYASHLKLSPRYHLVNYTQKILATVDTSKKAARLSKKIDRNLRDDILLNNAYSATNIIGGEEVLGKASKLNKKIQSRVRSEQVNIDTTFLKGVTDSLIKSTEYKLAVGQGAKPQEALAIVWKNNPLREAAIRNGNHLVSSTQFSGNKLSKAQFFREHGTVKDFFKQYRSFQFSMFEYAHDTMKIQDAQALKVLNTGNPQEVGIVEFSKAVDSYERILKNNIKKAAKAGELPDLTPKQVALVEKQVTTLNKELKKRIAKMSGISRGKRVGGLAKMWATASLIQFIFNGGLTSEDVDGGDVARAVTSGSPINVRTGRLQDNFVPAAAPLNAFGPYGGVSGQKLLNFVPVVGPVVNRARDLNRLMGGE